MDNPKDLETAKVVPSPKGLAAELRLRILRNLDQRQEKPSGDGNYAGHSDPPFKANSLEKPASVAGISTEWNILMAGLDQAGKFVNLGGGLPALPSRYPLPLRWMLRCLSPIFLLFNRYFLAEQREFNNAMLSCLHSFRAVLATMEKDSLQSAENLRPKELNKPFQSLPLIESKDSPKIRNSDLGMLDRAS